jgi:hypothetical protein
MSTARFGSYLRRIGAGSSLKSEAGPPIFRALGPASSFFGGVAAGYFPMRCVYCSKRAGFIRRVCTPCAKVVTIVDRAGGEVGLAGLVDIFVAEGLSREQVDVVLDAQVGAEPTIRDRLTSKMTNVLMRNLGMPGRQSPEDVMKVRTAMRGGGGAGTWVGGEEPPEHH